MGDIIYSVSADTLNGEADETLLRSEILASGVAIPESGLLNLVKLDRLGDVLTVTHVPTLNVAESGSLTLVVATHSGSALTGVFTPGPDDELSSHTGDPNAHHARYTDQEADNVSVTGIAAHAAISNAHHARYTDTEASGVAVQVVTTGILEHANLPSAHHTRYTDAEASGVAVQVVTTGILEHTNLPSAHHTRYTNAEAIAAASGALDHHARYTDQEADNVFVTGIAAHSAISDAHHARYTDAEASGVAVAVVTTGILEHTNISDAHHVRYTDSEAFSAVSGVLQINDLADVISASPEPNNVLTFDGNNWVPSGIASIGVTLLAFDYKFDSATADADPGQGNLRLNNSSQDFASGIFVDVRDTNDSVLTNLLLLASSGSILTIQERKDATRWKVYRNLVTPVLVGSTNNGYIRYSNVSILASGLDLEDGEEVRLGLIVGTESGPVSLALNDLTDVNVPSPSLNQVLAFNGSEWAPSGIHSRYTDAEASGVAVAVVTTDILEHTNLPSAHHARYTDQEADNVFVTGIAAHAAISDAHHTRYTDAEASGVAVQVVTTGILEHTNIPGAHHTRYTDSEAIAAATGNVTLQTSYDAGATGVIRLSSNNGPFIINDAGTPLDNILQIQNSAGTVDLLLVRGRVGETQVLIGSHDSIITGSNEPILKVGDEIRSIEIWPTDRRFTSSPGSLISTALVTHTHDYANVSFGGLNLQFTFEHAQAGFAFNHFLLFNNGITFKNENGVAVNFGPGQTFIAQPQIQADGASISMSQNRDFLSQPNFNTINGGALAVTTWGQIQLFGQINTGVTMTTRNAIQIGALLGTGGTLTTERGILLADLNRGTTIIGIDSQMTGTGKTFINHPGNTPSNFGGDIFMANGISLVLGTAAGNRVEILRSAAGTMRMIGQGGTNNEGLEWDFDTATANTIDIQSSTGAGLGFNLPAFTLGTTAADPTSNWQFLIGFGAKTISLAGDFARCLFTASANATIDAALTTFTTWTINEPAGTIGTGSVVNAANMIIQTAPSIGTNRYGLLITSNPTGGTLNYAFRQSNASARARFDGRLDINRGVALGGSGVATLGTTGSPGPTGVAQAQWLEIDIGGTPHWIPVWT